LVRTRGFPKEYWKAVLRDPRAAEKPSLPSRQMGLSMVTRLLRVECARCARCSMGRMRAALRIAMGPYGKQRESAEGAVLIAVRGWHVPDAAWERSFRH
jgi:hypothetical protein